MPTAPLGDIGPDNLEFIINHVFLPPKLPQATETHTETKNSTLLKLLQHVAETYYQNTTGSESLQWTPIIQMLTTLCSLENGSSLPTELFRNAMVRMKTGGKYIYRPIYGIPTEFQIDILALHITAQNAGLILRQSSDKMVFESFEVSPKSADVIGSKGRLLCSYPGPAIAVDIHKVKADTFLLEFGSFLENMKRDMLEQAMPKSSKAGTEISEQRETIHPKFITEMLTGILRAIGEPADVERIQKRIADDVLWDNAEIPWRRSPLWLVVRVTLQTSLKSSTHGHSQYKAFMVLFMARILELALQQDLASDLLFVMNAKLSRRVYKARDTIPVFVLDKAVEVGKQAYEVLDSRWKQAQKDHSKSADWNPQDLSFAEDTKLTMSNSKAYLREVIAKPYPKPETGRYKPNEVKRISLSSNQMPQQDISDYPAVAKDIALADFELWVQKNLDSWVTANVHREVACQQIAHKIEDYASAAKTAYDSDPQRISVMLLTSMELWVALDTVAVQSCPAENRPLFLEYFPEISETLLEPLLLPKVEQMARLYKIEQYLSKRRTNATSSNPSIFSNTVSDQAFAVRYFKNSGRHKSLEHQIQEQGRRERDQKTVEFNQKQREYDGLLARASVRSCDQYTNYRGYTHHDRYCVKCNLNDQAQQIRIDLHEWPLPESDPQRMAVVFELGCPMWFSIWRDSTYRVLVDIFTPPQSRLDGGEAPHESIETFAGVKNFYQNPVGPKSQRLRWSSSTKSWLSSHYREDRFPTTLSAINVKNGLLFGLFDTQGASWTENQIGNSDIRHACTFKLPLGPYKVLQYTVESTSHTSNGIMSNQSECPNELQLHEYLAFGLLRAGHRIQWLNIIRELRARALTFSNTEVNILIMQSAWQAGPAEPSETCRESHLDLQELNFGNNLLYELENMLAGIEGNWQEGVTAQTLIKLATRLLSVSNHAIIARRAVKFLFEARRVCLDWTRQLASKLRNCGEEDTKDFQLRTLRMAAICRTTYDVDKMYLNNVLRSHKDFEVAVECATIVHDNTPAIPGNLPLPTRALLSQDKRLAYAIESHLRSLILESKAGLDLTNVWGGYKPGARWRSLPEPNDRWMVTNTAADSTTHSQEVHYNLLNGELLVEGLPLGRMPLDYTTHPTYLELFGEVSAEIATNDRFFN